MARATTPQDLTITPRDRRFGRGMTQDRWWMGGDPVATAFYNALSATFPKGEAYFVESVRMFRDGTPPKLAEEIKAFVTQEVMHSREHVQFNKRALEAGYDMSPFDHPLAPAGRQSRRDHVPRTFYRDPRPPIAQESAPSRHGR
jgi:predicted metal-dependent hydrolase